MSDNENSAENWPTGPAPRYARSSGQNIAGDVSHSAETASPGLETRRERRENGEGAATPRAQTESNSSTSNHTGEWRGAPAAEAQHGGQPGRWTTRETAQHYGDDGAPHHLTGQSLSGNERSAQPHSVQPHSAQQYSAPQFSGQQFGSPYGSTDGGWSEASQGQQNGNGYAWHSHGQGERGDGPQGDASGYVYSGSKAEPSHGSGWRAPALVDAGDRKVAPERVELADVANFGAVELAPLRARGYARMIDAGFALVVAGLIGLVFHAVNQSQSTGVGFFVGQTILFYGFSAILGIIWYLYEAIFLLTLGRTPGKLFLGLQVVDAAGATKPKAGLAFMRPVLPALALVFWVPGVVLAVLVSLTALWDRSGRLQSIADRVSNALVVQAAPQAQSDADRQEAYVEVGEPYRR